MAKKCRTKMKNIQKIPVAVVPLTMSVAHPSSGKHNWTLISTSWYNLIKIESTTTELCSTQTHRHRHRHKQTDRQTETETDTDRLTDRQTDRQTDKQTM